MIGQEATGRRRAGVLAAVFAFVLLGGCGGPKTIDHYQPAVVADRVEQSRIESPEVVLAVQDFSTDSAYDERRIVYRKGSYKFSYYHFHRWAAPPGVLVSDALRKIYRNTGAFDAVVGGYSSNADVVLMGRVTSIEEVDVSDDEWNGHIAVSLQLRDAVTGELLWDETIDKKRRLEDQSPSGLADAVSRILADVGSRTAPKLAEIGARQIEKRAESGGLQKRESPDPTGSDEPETPAESRGD